MSDLSVAMLCVTALSVAGIAWDAFRRHLQGVSANAIAAHREEVRAALLDHELRMNDHWLKANAETALLREDNKAEFAAMKTAFDRTLTKEALQQVAVPRGQNARQY